MIQNLKNIFWEKIEEKKIIKNFQRIQYWYKN